MSLLGRLRSRAAAERDLSEEPVNSPGHNDLSLEEESNGESHSDSNATLSWAARTDVGALRSHNEDAYLLSAPTFGVCDGMGGHAAGEVASALAVETIRANAPEHADDLLLGAAIEEANGVIIVGAEQGVGTPGMGCTASFVSIELNKMAVAHVGDSRVYLLHNGTLVRLTHDHSYVEELIDAGEITADEARVHPSRSVITRALGSDPDMYADHFTIDVSTGDRVLICSDGLSSMVEDSLIESIATSSASPQAAVDNLVATALKAGGHDNVTVVAVDVLDDGLAAEHHRRRILRFVGTGLLISSLLALLVAVSVLFVRNSWYVGVSGGKVAVYRGVHASMLGRDLFELSEKTTVKLADLPDVVQENLQEGVVVSSRDEALATVESYREQIEADHQHAQEVADKTGVDTELEPENPGTTEDLASLPEAATTSAKTSKTSSSTGKGGE